MSVVKVANHSTPKLAVPMVFGRRGGASLMGGRATWPRREGSCFRKKGTKHHCLTLPRAEIEREKLLHAYQGGKKAKTAGPRIGGRGVSCDRIKHRVRRQRVEIEGTRLATGRGRESKEVLGLGVRKTICSSGQRIKKGEVPGE